MSLSRTIIGVLGVCLALATTAPALAQAKAPATSQTALVPAFKTLCDATSGDHSRALAAADAAGWAILPDEAILAGMAQVPGLKMLEGGARAQVINRELLMMIVGTAEMDADTVVEMCAVLTFKVQTEQAVAETRAMTGAEPANLGDDDPEMADMVMWVSINDAKGREYLSSMEGMRPMRAMVNGQLQMLMVGEQDGMTMIMQMRPIMTNPGN